MSLNQISEAEYLVKEWVAKRGSAKAQFNLGFNYERGKGVPQNYEQALKWYRLSAEQGYAHAQYFLGGMLAAGKGVKADFVEGTKWLGLAAEQGYDQAQYLIGMTHKKVTENYEAAVAWLKNSAEQNNSKAQHELGRMYENGQGVTEDLVQAHMWLHISGADEDAKKINARDDIEKKMTPAQIAEAQKLAREWMEKHNK